MTYHPVTQAAINQWSRVDHWVWPGNMLALAILFIALDHWYSYLFAGLVVLFGTALLTISAALIFWAVVTYRFPDSDEGDDYEEDAS